MKKKKMVYIALYFVLITSLSRYFYISGPRGAWGFILVMLFLSVSIQTFACYRRVRNFLINHSAELERFYGLRYIMPVYMIWEREHIALALLDEVSQRFGIRTPRLAIFGSKEQARAFAIGRGGDYTVGISEGVLSFSREELSGVFAHEIAHIVRGDIASMNFWLAIKDGLGHGALIVSFHLFLISQGFLQGAFARSKLSPEFFTSAALKLLLLYYIAHLFYAHLSRTKEYEADRHAIWAVGHGPLHATFLKLIAFDREEDRLLGAARWLSPGFLLRMGRDILKRIFLVSSHPTTSSRIKKMMVGPRIEAPVMGDPRRTIFPRSKDDPWRSGGGKKAG